MNNWSKALPFMLLLNASPTLAAENGGVTVGGTRLIYDGSKKEAALSVTNSDSNPYLIQSWIEAKTEGGEKAPFIITPPLFRLEGNQQNVLRIVRTGGNLPEDRESLYWMNIKSIPATTKKEGVNTLQIAVNTRIKLIYRPQGVSGTPETVTDKLAWSQSGNKLTVTNPTPFIMNFQQVKVGGREIPDVTYVMPMGQASFVVPAGTSGKVSWRLISDYGGIGDEHTGK
ncbi:molecular chaperone [Serratia marcescens]|uniref:fimbrial biogenesis chaperone n=1 Tax=Serratia TaxID=613 RepID=UPI0015D730DA|nr:MULTISPECIES: fimbria/pilus periplasmic chaperone [Serratia]MBJ2089994.1 fimbria/pilus periplasmic chaperone [Serratia ureilytica]MBN3987614.1 fimbria/pilus periplasmic chaperone [Serratia marcescens]MCX2173128.1 fimbria/pilus periplasmic chaperone [Serratia marcescens]MCX2177251.1 fimbria/pilus periplasmic chaperone [Serratia marcescens]QLJ58496.1 fimbria/pilus periplasmic chaperone [Serratia marcescens]